PWRSWNGGGRGRVTARACRSAPRVGQHAGGARDPARGTKADPRTNDRRSRASQELPRKYRRARPNPRACPRAPRRGLDFFESLLEGLRPLDEAGLRVLNEALLHGLAAKLRHEIAELDAELTR